LKNKYLEIYQKRGINPGFPQMLAKCRRIFRIIIAEYGFWYRPLDVIGFSQ